MGPPVCAHSTQTQITHNINYRIMYYVHVHTEIKVNKVNTANKFKFFYVLNEGIRYQVYLLFVHQ